MVRLMVCFHGASTMALLLCQRGLTLLTALRVIAAVESLERKLG